MGHYDCPGCGGSASCMCWRDKLEKKTMGSDDEWSVADRYFNHAGWDPNRKDPEPLPVGVPIPLGGVPWPSNDEGVEAEIRAAELRATMDPFGDWTQDEMRGYFLNYFATQCNMHGGAPENAEQEAGWLWYEMCEPGERVL